MYAHDKFFDNIKSLEILLKQIKPYVLKRKA
jgi:hypothetical protein